MSVGRSDEDVIRAIVRARNGIENYIAIRDRLYVVDVSQDRDFQRLYNHFYKVRQKSREWYVTYYWLLETYKRSRPEFSVILEEIRKRLDGAYEPSFSSKLVATIDPWKPIWDTNVLRNTELVAPPYASPSKHQDAVAAYASIVAWYREFMTSRDARCWVNLFNIHVEHYYKITDSKKIDFILWQLRDLKSLNEDEGIDSEREQGLRLVQTN